MSHERISGFLATFADVVRKEHGEVFLDYDFHGCFFKIYAAKRTIVPIATIKSHVFVTVTNDFVDLSGFQEYDNLFAVIKKGVESWLVNEFFFLVVVSDKGFAGSVISLVDQFPKGSIFKGGVGCLCLVDLENRKVYMKIPWQRISAKICNGLVNEIESAFAPAEKLATTSEEREAIAERQVLDYIITHDHKIKVSDASVALSMTNKEVEDAIGSLQSKGILMKKNI